MDTTAKSILPPSGSTLSGQVDELFQFVFIASAVFFFIVLVATLYFVFRYRKRTIAQVGAGPGSNLKLEILWTVIPTILVFIIFLWGFRVYLKMQIVPPDAIEIKVTAQKWFWSFDYPEGVSSLNTLVVPVDQPVRLTMSSTDVIHSFFVPGFRLKMDVLPNRYTITWFEANKTGTYDLFCAEYCGTQHSEMIGKVKIVARREYEEWLQSAATSGKDIPLKEYGAQLYQSKACITCHTIDGKPMIGPTFLDLYGASHQMADGETITADENYLRESILDPQARIIAGYQPVMPTYQGILKDREIDALVEYIKSLSQEQR